MNALKKYFILLTLVALTFQSVAYKVVFAETLGDIVINEVAWAGTADNSNDEWIELYNNTDRSVDLSGWIISDDDVPSYTIASGTMAPHGYFLIEDSEETVSNITADAVIGLSLANAGDSLILKNPAGTTIDSVNISGGAWYSGDGNSKATMERIDPAVFADNASNWATVKSGNGSTGRGGSPILGTPRGANSNFSGGTKVLLSSSETSLDNGESFIVAVKAEKVVNLYAYGFEINYDPAVLEFVSINESNFLKADGVPTSFNHALENEAQGKLIVGNARLENPPSGVDGTGDLFNITFKAIGEDGTSSEISAGGSSFLSDISGDIVSNFVSVTVNIGVETNISAVNNLQAVLGTDLYSFRLNWGAPSSGADKYIVRKQLANGSFVILGEVTTLS